MQFSIVKSPRWRFFLFCAILFCVGARLLHVVMRYEHAPIRSTAAKVSQELFQRRFEVIFDQSNEQVYSPFDVGFTGMSEWTRVIQNQGGGVSLNSQPLSERLDALAGPHQVLVLGVALERRYPPADLDAIDRFLHRGGGVLVLVEHDNVMENATFQNELLKRYGVEAEYSSGATHMESAQSIWTWTRYQPWALERIQFFFPAPLLFQPRSIMRPMLEIIEPVNPERSVIGARSSEKSKLQLIVLADAEMVWNGAEVLGFSVGDNAEFMGRVMTDLARVPYSKEQPTRERSRINLSSPTTDQTPATLPRALFLRDGEAQVPDNQTIGLANWYHFIKNSGYQIDIAYYNEVFLRHYDVVISVNPLAPLEVPREWLNAMGQVIVVADGQSDYFNSGSEAKQLVGEFFSEKVFAPTHIPSNDLLKSTGLKFIPATLVDDQVGDQGFAVQLRDSSGKLSLIHRSSAVAVEAERAQPAIVLACSPGSWPSLSLTPYITDDVPKPIFKVPEGYLQEECYPVVVQSGNTVAVGSLELTHHSAWLKKILSTNKMPLNL